MRQLPFAPLCFYPPSFSSLFEEGEKKKACALRTVYIFEDHLLKDKYTSTSALLVLKSLWYRLDIKGRNTSCQLN